MTPPPTRSTQRLPRLPLSLRLAVRQLRRDRLGSVLSAVFLAVPTTLLIVVTVVSSNAGSGCAGTGCAASAAGMTAGVATLVLPLVLVIVVMMAANLLVAGRRSERMLALLSSVGAPPAALFRLVSATGIIMGAGAAAVSLVAGIPIAWAWLGRVAAFSPVAVLGLASLAVVFGWAASVVPAIAATTVDANRVLRDIPRQAGGEWRTDRIGAVLTASGLAMVAVGAAFAYGMQQAHWGQSQPPFWVGAIGGVGASALTGLGTLVAPVGILLMLPRGFRMIGHAVSRLGLAPRLASRDAERRWGRSVSAGAAVLVTSFAVSGYLSLATLSAAGAVRDFGWTLQEGQVAVPLIDAGYGNGPLDPRPIGNPDAIVGALDDAAGFEELRVLDGVQGPFYGWPVEEDEGYSGRQEMVFPVGGLPHPRLAENPICPDAALPGWRCETPHYYDSFSFPLDVTTPTIWVGDADDVRLILDGSVDAATLAALERGDALVFDTRYLAADGTVTIDWHGEGFVPEDEPGEFLPAGPPLRSHTVNGHLVPLDHRLDYGIVVTAETAAELSLVAQPSRVLAALTGTPTRDEQDAIYAAIDAAGRELTGREAFWLAPTVEAGPSEFDYAWIAGALLLGGGISLAVALVAVGLARVEGRGTDRTLATLGAEPGIRRRISAWYAIIVVGLASVSGTLLGATTASASMLGLGTTGGPPLAGLPLLELAALGLGVPLLAAAVARLVPAR